MKLLFIAPYLPSPIRVRTYQLLRALVGGGAEVTLVALDDPFATPVVREELASLCRQVHTIALPKRQAALRCLAALPTPTPLWVAYCRSPQLLATVRALVARTPFDAAHVEHLRAAFVGEALGTLPTVFDAVDCITALQKQMFEQPGSLPARLLAGEEWLKLRHYEPRAYAPFDQIAVTSAYDAEALVALGTPLPPITVIPNGVDLTYFHPDTGVQPEHNTLVFSGKMSYRANDDAARYFIQDILPKIQAERPHVHLIVAGSEPSAALQSLAKNSDNVTITGFVDDLRPFLSRGAVAVCPLRIGVGIQNKALEAMAMGRPVVATPLAGRALQAAVGDGITIAESTEAFAQHCLTLLAEPERAAQQGAAARRYVEKHHRWDCAASAFRDRYSAAGYKKK